MLQQLVLGLIPVGVLAVGLGVIAAMAKLWLRSSQKNDRTTPLTRDLLRPPGYSLRKRVEAMSDEINSWIAATVMLPLMVFAGHISVSYFGKQPESILRVLVTSAAGTALLADALRRLVPQLKERRKFVLAIDGEMATGEELNQLMLAGCRVFHDIEYPYGNIDHVVVSPSGVYCINTKMRGKPRNAQDQAKLIVDYERTILKFPDGEFRLPVDAAETEAKWLSNHLSQAVGVQIAVEPILAYPGWFVERIGRGSPFVINPHRPLKFFVQSRVVLTPELIQQTAHQLEQLCRDVKPVLRKNRQWETAMAR